MGFQEIEAPDFLDYRHMTVVRLSALCTGRLYRQDRPRTVWYKNIKLLGSANIGSFKIKQKTKLWSNGHA